jgi:hypothetical protein
LSTTPTTKIIIATPRVTPKNSVATEKHLDCKSTCY